MKKITAKFLILLLLVTNCGLSFNNTKQLSIPKDSEARVLQINLKEGRIKKLYGINFGIFNKVEKGAIGLQLGASNEGSLSSGFLIQGGGWNFGGSLQIGGLNMLGIFQAGIINFAGGIQIGIMNMGNIFQVGVYNVSGGTYTMQIGIINRCDSGRFMILLNFCDKDRSEKFREWF